MGLIVRDGLGHLFERLEALLLLLHERPDLGGALGFDPRSDVDHHQRGRVDMALTDRDHAGRTSHRRADQNRRFRADRVEHPEQVPDVGVAVVLAGGTPVGVAVAPSIEGDCVVSGLTQGLAGPAPRMAGLATAVQQHDQPAAGVAPCVASNHEAVAARPLVHRFGGSRQSGARDRHGGHPAPPLAGPPNQVAASWGSVSRAPRRYANGVSAARFETRDV